MNNFHNLNIFGLKPHMPEYRKLFSKATLPHKNPIFLGFDNTLKGKTPLQNPRDQIDGIPYTETPPRNFPYKMSLLISETNPDLIIATNSNFQGVSFIDLNTLKITSKFFYFGLA
jgi:hypothetical protein